MTAGRKKKPTPIITLNCIAVFGTGQVGRSCSKICLVKIYPKHEPDIAIKAYVMLDDQSNQSLAKSSLFELFNIE